MSFESTADKLDVSSEDLADFAAENDENSESNVLDNVPQA